MNDTHTYCCCRIHGCKYRDPNCPVVHGYIIQQYECHQCFRDGKKTIKYHEALDKRADENRTRNSQ